MIEYYEQLMQEEQEAITEIIQTLLHQTFILEQKFDRRAGRLQYEKDYRICTRHFEFLKAYFAISGIQLCENAHMGMIYIQGETLWGEKLPKLATIYLLLLKLIYDEQMATVSSSSHIVTTLGAINGKAGEFRVLKGLPSPTEMKRTISMLKKYQIIEPLDAIEELNESTRMVIYPSIHAVLMGDDIRELLATFGEGREPKAQQTVFHKDIENEAGQEMTEKETIENTETENITTDEVSEEEHRGETTAI